MKIGIFAPYLTHNYGTVLQAFALQHVFDSMGYYSEYVRFVLYKKDLLSRIIFFVKNPKLLYYIFRSRNESRGMLDYEYFDEPEFREVITKNNFFCKDNIRESSEIYTWESNSLKKLYDLFVVGSDQTWYPGVIYQYSPFFLRFLSKKERKVSYAPSFGTSIIPDNYKRFLKKTLASFDNISCRDPRNTLMLKELLNRDVELVLDPTLLVNRQEWDKYMQPVDVPHNYVLCYILGERQIITDFAEALGRKLDIPVYYILTRPCHKNHRNIFSNIGCDEFLYLIANCDYVVTDSFHGTIFSINFNKEFISFDKYENKDSFDNGRIRDVLEQFKLEDHYHDGSNFTMPNKINYEFVNTRLDNMRMGSLKYISSLFKN